MTDHIKVTCEHCQHVVKAPRSAGGRRGKCPHCGNSVYVPTPEDELEEIPLAPIDPSRDAEAEKLEEEARTLAARLRQEASEQAEKRTPAKPAPRPSRPTTDPQPPPKSAGDLTQAIVGYLHAMEVSNLEKADRIAGELKAAGPQARDRVQQLLVDSIKPHAVADMPTGLYQGLLKKLLERL